MKGNKSTVRANTRNPNWFAYSNATELMLIPMMRCKCAKRDQNDICIGRMVARVHSKYNTHAPSDSMFRLEIVMCHKNEQQCSERKKILRSDRNAKQREKKQTYINIHAERHAHLKRCTD